MKLTLKNTAEAHSETLFELNYIFEIRWVPSELGALQKIKANFIILCNNFEQIQAGSDLDEDTKQQAHRLENNIKKVRFYATTLYMTDVLKLLAQALKNFQKHIAVVIGQEKWRENLLNLYSY